MNDAVPELALMLARLGYTQAWLASGVVTPELVAAQCAALETSGDPNGEHYRARAFIAFLEQLRHLTDDQLDALLALRDAGTDGVDLSANRRIALLNSGLLAEDRARSERVRTWADQPPSRRVYRRLLFRLELRRTGLTESIFEQLRAEGDAELERAALAAAELSVEQAEWLSVHGSNHRVRNVATQRREQLAKRRARR
jgi:hypothetical protein